MPESIIVNKQTQQLRDALETLYVKYNRRELIQPDPLQFVYRYSKRGDMEIAGFLASCLAYGRVQQIEKSLTVLLKRMGNSPLDYVMNFDKKESQTLRNFKHRFTSGDDIADLLAVLKLIIGKFGSIEKFFVKGYNRADSNIIPALTKFCDSLLAVHAQNHKGHIPRGLQYLLPSPAAGSVCKRLNLFLRWMVRRDDVDAGLWKSIDKAKLIIPVDVHMGRLCKILGFYDQKSVSMKAAIKITQAFAKISPDDPVKYDFALSRIGIVEHCTGRLRKDCEICDLRAFCSK